MLSIYCVLCIFVIFDKYCIQHILRVVDQNNQIGNKFRNLHVDFVVN